MKKYENIEDKLIDAYCRLEYDIWYQGYKDDVSKYLKKRPLYNAISTVAKLNIENKTIKVSGELCDTNEKLDNFIEDILFFLGEHKDYTIIFVLPYEKQKVADSIAYKKIAKIINDNIIINEMNKTGYVIQISKRCYLGDILFINLYSDKTVKYGKNLDKDFKIVKGQFKIDDSLYEKIYKWAKNHADTFIDNGELVGRYISKEDEFQVCISFRACGIKLDSYLHNYSFKGIEGHGALTELLQLPELKVLFEEDKV